MSNPINSTTTDSVKAVLAAGAGYYFMGSSQTKSQASYKTTPAKTGNLSVTVTATGNLQPKNQVDIGTELSGTVDAVLVDANEVVKKGQKLASLNTTQLQDTITKGKASLASAQAKVKQSAASVKEARTKLNRLQLRSSETNLGKATITSPINGVVLTRTVEPGQTVASSLSAPTLFTLAEDLAQMEVEVGVDEADVGQVKAGQKAEFSVDAWPGRKYPAEITRVSLGADTSENVVSYLTVLAVQNTDLTLRPGMTATATIKTESRENVLLIPNTALRFTPVVASVPAAASANSSFISQLMPRLPSMGTQKKRTNGTPPVASPDGMQKIWVLDNNAPLAVEVKTGISDGKQTEIVSGNLKEGMAVITESTGGTTGGKP